MNHDEWREQCTVIQACGYITLDTGEKVSEYIYAIENESGGTTPQKGERAKKAGKKAGVSDLHLPVPIYPYCGLWIEMKRKIEKGKPKPKTTLSQQEWINKMRKQGHYACVCFGAEQAIEIIKKYVKSELYHYKEP